MQTRREMLAHSATVAGMLAAAGLLPATAHAAWNEGAFAAKSLADAVKAFGGGAPAESKDVTITGPDIAENGAVVPVGASTTLAGVKRLMIMVEKNPNALAASFEVTDKVERGIDLVSEKVAEVTDKVSVKLHDLTVQAQAGLHKAKDAVHDTFGRTA